MARNQPIKLGQRVKTLLQERGWSQATLAETAGIESSRLSRLLSGKRAWTIADVESVARALGVESPELVNGTEEAKLVTTSAASSDREYVDTLKTELARAMALFRDAQAEIDALQRSNAELEFRAEQLSSEVERLRRELEVAKVVLSRTQAQNNELSAQVAAIRSDLLARDRTIAVLESKTVLLTKSLEVSNRQLATNYEAWRQSQARVQELESQSGQQSKNTTVAALFAGLLGVGLGAAAAASSADTEVGSIKGRRRRGT